MKASAPAPAKKDVPAALPFGRGPMEAFAIAAPGLARYVAAELETLGVRVQRVEAAGVVFAATPAVLFRVNCWSRLATRVVVRLATFEARDFATLEQRARRVPWAAVLSASSVAELSVTCRKSRLYHSDAVAERIARSIERVLPGIQVGKATGDDEVDDTDERAAQALPSELPRTQRLLVRLDRDVVTVSADSSGELLHRRGWRLDSGKAPLRETLAAALLVSCNAQPELPLIDPMCGAGTIAIEAALMARRIAPGLSRSFACEFWPIADQAVAAAERALARAEVLAKAPAPIVAADRDAGAMEASRTNAERAGVLSDITLLHQPLSVLQAADWGAEGWIATNPPYGIRTGNPESLRALWGQLGAKVRAAGTGWNLGVVVPDRALSRELRLPLDQVAVTTNGGRTIAFLRSRPPAR